MLLEGKKTKFKLFDFSAPLWKTIDEIGEAAPDSVDTPVTLLRRSSASILLN